MMKNIIELSASTIMLSNNFETTCNQNNKLVGLEVFDGLNGVQVHMTLEETKQLIEGLQEQIEES